MGQKGNETTAAERAADGATVSRTKRVIYVTLGCFFVLLGLIGVLLPVLPTTPFLLVALWAFARSSRSLHDWLLHHRFFGPPLQRWKRERTIPVWVKTIAIGSMSLSATYVTLFLQPRWEVLAGIYVFVGISAFFVLRIPSKRPPAAVPPQG